MSLTCTFAPTFFQPLLEPYKLRVLLPLSAALEGFVQESRRTIMDILERKDPRLLVVVGPCSIHDIKAGEEYAQKLASLSQKLSDRLYIVMRAYFEKPRTACGWKGFIMDPHLDGSHAIAYGLEKARSFLQTLLKLGLPTATEILDVITPHYLEDCLCWAAIGARTIESQIHRQLASSLKMPLGFKNNTSGSISSAIHAYQASRKSQTFLGVDAFGKASVLSTSGNPAGHIVLRGSKTGPNYDAQSLTSAALQLKEHGLTANIMVDCSHGNSSKHGQSQEAALESIIKQIPHNSNLMGVMFESNLHSGNQSPPDVQKPGLGPLQYGVSITDPCLSWPQTKHFLHALHGAMQARFTPI